jgi:hypothetical protein
VLLCGAQATQGYVLRDLVRLSRRIALLARVRITQRRDDDGQQSVGVAPRVERQDMEVAMAAVRPSQMFELTVRPPRVSWDDVAGCENARRELEEAVKYVSLPLIYISIIIIIFALLILENNNITGGAWLRTRVLCWLLSPSRPACCCMAPRAAARHCALMPSPRRSTFPSFPSRGTLALT